MATIKDIGFKEGFSHTLIWAFLNYNIVMQWINLDDWIQTYDTFDTPVKHTMYFMYILSRIYINTFVCLALLLLTLILIYFLILKMLSFDSGVFNRLVNGDKTVIKEFLPVQNEKDTDITARDLFDMTFSCFYTKTSFLAIHAMITIFFSVLFSTLFTNHRYFRNKDNRKPVLHTYFIMLFLITNYHFTHRLIPQ